MKHTIKLDPTKSIQLEDVGAECHLRLLTFGTVAIKQVISPATLSAICNAGMHVANAADRASRGVRCHDADACKAGQAPCPCPQACGLGEG